MGLFKFKNLLLASTLVFLAGCSGNGNKEFDMTLGGTRHIGGGATLWFGSVEDQWRQDLGGIVTAAMVEVKCPGESSGLMPVFTDRPTEQVCGVRLRLVEFKGGFVKPVETKMAVYQVRLQLIRDQQGTQKGPFSYIRSFLSLALKVLERVREFIGLF